MLAHPERVVDTEPLRDSDLDESDPVLRLAVDRKLAPGLFVRLLVGANGASWDPEERPQERKPPRHPEAVAAFNRAIRDISNEYKLQSRAELFEAFALAMMQH